MTRSFLIATAAALAIIVPGQAQAGDRQAKAEERAQKAKERAQAKKADNGKQRASRAQARPQAAERRQQRVSRAQARPKAAERRQQRVRADRPKARERASVQQQRQRVRAEQPRQRVRAEQPRQRVEAERRATRVERRARPQERVVERRSPTVNRVRPQRVERQRVERQRIERQSRPQRVVRSQIRPMERRPAVEQRSRTIESRSAGRLETQQLRQQQRQAEKLARTQNRIERRQGRLEGRTIQPLLEGRTIQPLREALVQRPSRTVGDRLTLRSRQVNRDSNDGHVTQRFSSRYDASPQHFYYHDDDDGYLYQVRRDTNRVTAQFPLLGGAFGVGQALPVGYSSYNVPSAYRSLYYDTPNYRYRYGDGAIYRVDSSTLLIQAVVALLSGRSFGVGQMLPAGYGVYNVPYGYRDTYFDTDDMWYRYNDGYIYGVDPYSRRIQSMHPVSYGGYAVGYPVPSYASYGGYTGFGGYGAYPASSVPYGYNSLYHSQPGYNYQYANGGIYQIDPATRIITALVALVSGANLGVGQMLPAGYDAYNVPYAYRDRYFDTADSWHRYDDGYIYQVDPYSRVIQTAVPVSYGGYSVGQPVPAAYPGYPVPDRYSGLYQAQPGYDYRYFDGGIYQVDPTTRVVQALVALLTGQTLGVGQMLPAGYDAYNVPYDYRDRYHDTDRFMYRYADGYIYQVDPQTRLIQKVIDAIA